ncbi:MAG TPA: 4-(cytidine 5'-diphospho)-2-C-methyl-D-erythritol kinase, partial [Hyphomicrobiaceae bacterium]|nr:4-(cytidine 5'-diphospho)-2-C-methyl-D-erythritol kinase [Hyphomicrobiaceae bacterium]
MLSESAPAKVNLFLRVLGRRPDGYHELSSLAVFALDCADTLELTPGEGFRLDVTGPFAPAVDGPNIIGKAVELAVGAKPGLRLGHFKLTKRLPVAAGIGGGSADAAAALRLLRRLNPGASDLDWHAIAKAVGADVPVCLAGVPSLMAGIGERLQTFSGSFPLSAVLANPRVPLATADVFRALGAPLLPPGARPAEPNIPAADGPSFLHWLRQQPNDMESAARRLCPAVSEVLAVLGSLPGVRLVRMSGSGPTCFGLFDDPPAARAA